MTLAELLKEAEDHIFCQMSQGTVAELRALMESEKRLRAAFGVFDDFPEIESDDRGAFGIDDSYVDAIRDWLMNNLVELTETEEARRALAEARKAMEGK